MTAREVKHRLYGRHPGSGEQMPGPWTAIEEWRCIDFLAFSAWSSQGKYARVGYEVKVSRSDLRSELLNPGKRAANVAWCNEFYFAVPVDLLRPEELAYVEPEWADADWRGERCPGFAGQPCQSHYRKKTHKVYLVKPSTSRFETHEYVTCPTCSGRGTLAKSRVEEEAPTCWIPNDVGLVVVDGRGTRVVKKSPRRKEVPALDPAELGALVRWVSMRPDPRHAARRNANQMGAEVAA